MWCDCPITCHTVMVESADRSCHHLIILSTIVETPHFVLMSIQCLYTLVGLYGPQLYQTIWATENNTLYVKLANLTPMTEMQMKYYISVLMQACWCECRLNVVYLVSSWVPRLTKMTFKTDASCPSNVFKKKSKVIITNKIVLTYTTNLNRTWHLSVYMLCGW